MYIYSRFLIICVLPWFACIIPAKADEGRITYAELDFGYQFHVPLSPEFLTGGAIGAISTAPWNLGDLYPVKISCTTPITGDMGYSIFYRLENDLKSSGTNPDFQVFNDYLDVKVDVWIEGNIQSYITLPWSGKGTTNNKYHCTPPSSELYFDGGSPGMMGTGAKGIVTFKVTKRIVNGIKIPSKLLARVMGRLSQNPIPPLTTGIMSQVKNDPVTIVVPDKCVINEGTLITVEFGTLPGNSEKLDGNNFSQPVPVHMVCEGGSFEEGHVEVNLTMRTGASGVASFNPQYLGTTGDTDRSNLGIKLTTTDGAPVVPNTVYPYASDVGTTEFRWNIIAAPIAKPGSVIPEGEFSAAATIVADFQ